MTPPGRRVTTLLVLLLLSAVAVPARAERTPLLKVDLQTGKKTAIDQRGPKTDVDKQLDALLDSSTGKSFSTAELGKIESAVRRYLRATRPRAMPRLLLFVYPGRMTSAKLKELREVLIDIDLVVDPCGRTVCKDSVAKHLEIIGKSLKQAEIRTADYLVRFKSVTVRTSTQIGGAQYDIYSFSADEVVRAGRSGGGQQLVRRVQGAQQAYGREMAKAAARKIGLRRVRLVKTPRIERQASTVTVEIEIRSDRVRFQSHVLGALVGTMQALRQSSLTPSTVKLTVTAVIPHRKTSRRVFRSSGKAVLEHLDGRLTSRELWASYVVEERKDIKQMTFSDADTKAGGASDSGPDRSAEILASNMGLLSPCLQAEAGRSRSFRGVTLQFAISGSGRATRVRTKESVSARLKSCLQAALRQIPFQRHGGAPREISYPMLIKR